MAGRRGPLPRPVDDGGPDPAGLPKDAADAWDHLARHLAIAGRLRPEDLPALEQFVRAWALYRKVLRQVEAGQVVQVNKNGTTSVNPRFKVLAELERVVERGVRHFGLTPAARGGLGARGPDPAEREFDDFLASRPADRPAG